jgi:ubiquinone/menaquinone biosynthesis C-methylase UbiE
METYDLQIQNKVKNWFDDTYQNRKFAYLRPEEAYEIFISLLNPKKGKKLLDVACGPGLLLKRAIEKGINSYGIDISEVAVGLSKSFVPDAKTLLGNAENLPFSDEEFDFVTCIGSLERFLDTEKSLNEMKRVSKADARFCFMVRNSDTVIWKIYRQFLRRKKIDAHMEAKNLVKWTGLFLSNGFEIVSVYPDQWTGFRLRKKIFFWKKVDYEVIHKNILPLKYANEFIFILKKKNGH